MLTTGYFLVPFCRGASGRLEAAAQVRRTLRVFLRQKVQWSPFCDSLVTCRGGVQNFRAGKSIAVTQSLPPAGFSKQGVVDRNLTGLSTSGYNHNLFVGSKLGYHPELVDQIRIVLTELRRMDLSGTRPRMRALLRHGINNQITTLIGTVLQRTALYRKGTLPNSQYHCIEDLSDELFSPTLPAAFDTPWSCLEESSPPEVVAG